jgi:hypothetical protein
MNISKILKNGRKITVNNINIDSVYDRIFIEPSSPEMINELMDTFRYPSCQWGDYRSSIMRKDFDKIAQGILPDFFISLWLTSSPLNDDNFDGSELIISFFSNLDISKTLDEIISDGLDDIDNVYEDYAMNFEL